jgi:hypothetical protein
MRILMPLVYPGGVSNATPPPPPGPEKIFGMPLTYAVIDNEENLFCFVQAESVRFFLCEQKGAWSSGLNILRT